MRVLAAHLERQALVHAAARLADDAAGLGRAGERDDWNRRDGSRSPRRRLRPRPCTSWITSGGKAGLEQDLDEHVSGVRHVFGGLEDARVSAEQRREHLPRRNRHREVERRDDARRRRSAGGSSSPTCCAARSARCGRTGGGLHSPRSTRCRCLPARRRASRRAACPSRASSRSAISSFRLVMRSPTRRSTSPRAGAGVRRQISNPRCAPTRPPCSTSAAPDSGKRPIASSRVGRVRDSRNIRRRPAAPSRRR